MLSPAEVHQAAVRAAPDAVVVNRSSLAYATLPEEAGKGVRETTIDIPRVEVTFEGDVRVTFHLDDLDQTRWVATIQDGDRQASRALLTGAGSVAEQVDIARELAGLPEPTRPARPSSLTFGGAA